MNASDIFCTYLFSQFQGYTYKVLQTIQMKLILLCVMAEWAALGSAKTALKLKYEMYAMGQGISLKSERNNPLFKPRFNILLHTRSIVCATV